MDGKNTIVGAFGRGDKVYDIMWAKCFRFVIMTYFVY